MITINIIMITYLIGSVSIKCITGAEGLAILISFIFGFSYFKNLILFKMKMYL